MGGNESQAAKLPKKKDFTIIVKPDESSKDKVTIAKHNMTGQMVSLRYFPIKPTHKQQQLEFVF